jgi:hypothetical protein
LGFLGASPFGFETPGFEPWILLDFLGFPRLNRDFSTGYAEKTAKDFSSRFLQTIRDAQKRECAVEAMRKRKIAHEPSLTDFLIICNKLPSSRSLAASIGKRLVRRSEAARLASVELRVRLA